MKWVIDKLLTFTGYAALAVVSLLLAVYAWLTYMNTAELGRYRFLVTTRIEVDGEVKSASSVIELRVTPRIEAYNFGFDFFGTAASFQLPRGGMLFVPLSIPEAMQYAEKGGAPLNLYDEATPPSMIYSAYYPKSAPGKWDNVRPSFEKAKKISVPDKSRPGFIWVPERALTYADLRFLHSHELSTPAWSRELGYLIKYLDTTIEPTTAQLATRQPLEAPWIVSVREKSPQYLSSVRNAFELGER